MMCTLGGRSATEEGTRILLGRGPAPHFLPVLDQGSLKLFQALDHTSAEHCFRNREFEGPPIERSEADISNKLNIHLTGYVDDHLNLLSRVFTRSSDNELCSQFTGIR